MPRWRSFLCTGAVLRAPPSSMAELVSWASVVAGIMLLLISVRRRGGSGTSEQYDRTCFMGGCRGCSYAAVHFCAWAWWFGHRRAVSPNLHYGRVSWLASRCCLFLCAGVVVRALPSSIAEFASRPGVAATVVQLFISVPRWGGSGTAEQYCIVARVMPASMAEFALWAGVVARFMLCALIR